MPFYYLWCGGSYDEGTEDIEVARRREKDALDAGADPEYTYIIEGDGRIIDETYMEQE